jgi:hypothetical protein
MDQGLEAEHIAKEGNGLIEVGNGDADVMSPD